MACVVEGSLIFSSHAAMVLRGSGKASRRSRGPSGFLKAWMRGLLIKAGRLWIWACLASQPMARIMTAEVHLCTPLSCWLPSLQSCRRSTMRASVKWLGGVSLCAAALRNMRMARM